VRRLHGSKADDVAKGGRDLPRPQAAPIVIADDDESRFRDGFGRDDLGPFRAPGAFVRAVRVGRAPVRLRICPQRSTVGPPAASRAWLIETFDP